MKNCCCEACYCCNEEPEECYVPCEGCNLYKEIPQDFCDYEQNLEYKPSCGCCNEPYICYCDQRPKCCQEQDSSPDFQQLKCQNNVRDISPQKCKGFHSPRDHCKCREECPPNCKKVSQEDRRKTCKFPLTTYQATHNALAIKILCKEVIIPAFIGKPPPCNICDRIFPPCREVICSCCGKPSDDDGENKRKLQSEVDRYWTPCFIEY